MEVLVYAAALDSGPDTAADTDDAESGPTAVVNRRRAAAASRFSACLQTFLFLFGLSAIVVGFIGVLRGCKRRLGAVPITGHESIV